MRTSREVAWFSPSRASAQSEARGRLHVAYAAEDPRAGESAGRTLPARALPPHQLVKIVGQLTGRLASDEDAQVA